MRFVRVAGWALVLGLAGSACSDSSADETDLLRGVDDATAAALCGEFLTVQTDLVTARNTLQPSGIDDGATAYEALATKARTAGAKTLSAELRRVAAATSALADAADQPPPEMSQLMARGLRVQLHETTVQLACAEHGIVR